MLRPVYVPSLLMAVSQEALTILLPLSMLDIGASPAFAAGFVLLSFAAEPALLGLAAVARDG